MIFRTKFLVALFGCAILVGCNGSDDKTDTAQSPGTFNDTASTVKAGIEEPVASLPAEDSAVAFLPVTTTTP